jgi:hypothetical protein
MKQAGIKSVMLMAMLTVTTPVFAATQAPQVSLLAGDHGWAECRYEAPIELQPGLRAFLMITAQREGYGPSSVRLEMRGGVKSASTRTVRLLAPGSAPLLDIHLPAGGSKELPRDAVSILLDALTQRTDLMLEVSDGGVTKKVPATPVFPGSADARQQWQSCVKELAGA